NSGRNGKSLKMGKREREGLWVRRVVGIFRWISGFASGRRRRRVLGRVEVLFSREKEEERRVQGLGELEIEEVVLGRLKDDALIFGSADISVGNASMISGPNIMSLSSSLSFMSVDHHRQQLRLLF
ncbi:hypothetical protein MTR67_024444, partial [Solanum verrucosum]